MEASPTGKGQHIGVVLFWLLIKYLKSINCKNKLKNILLNVERSFSEWSFSIYNDQIKSSNLIISHKPSIYLYSCHINLISQNKSQKKSKIYTLTY